MRSSADAQQEVAKAGEDPDEASRKPKPPSSELDALTYAKALEEPAQSAGRRPAQDHVEDGHLRPRFSYHGAQIFEAIGIGETVIEKCFDGTPSQVGGIGFVEIARESLARHEHGLRAPCPRKPKRRSSTTPATTASAARASATPSRRRSSRSFHAFVKTNDPDEVQGLRRERAQASSRSPSRTCSSSCHARAARSRSMKWKASRKSARASPPPACRSARSRREAHEALAIAMNRIGGKSNSGEGGEDPERFKRPRRTATARTAPSSRSPPGVSASPPPTSPAPRKSRSRWPRARSPAKAASFPATRSAPSSRGSATPCPA